MAGIGFMVLVQCNEPIVDQRTVGTQIDSFLQRSTTTPRAVSFMDNVQDAIKNTAALNNDSLKMVSYNKIAFAIAEKTDTTLFIKINRKALLLAEQREDSIGIAQAHWNYGIHYLVRNLYVKSYAHYESAYEHFKNKHSYFAGKMLYHMAYINSRNKNYTGSEILLYKAILIFKPLKKYKQLYLCHSLLGAVYDNLNEYNEALRQYQIAYKYLDKVALNKLHLQDYYNNIGVLYQKLGRQEEAIRLFDEALKLKELRLIDASLYARLIDNRAYSYFLLGVDNELPQVYETALHIRDSIQNKPGVVMSHIHLASYYLSVKDTTQALKHGAEAYAIGKELKLNRDTLGALLLLAEINPKNSRYYLREHIRLNEILIREERKLRNKFTRIEYDTDNYIAENERLIRDKILIIAGGTAVSLIFFLLFVNFRQRAKNKVLAYKAEQQKAKEKIYILDLERRDSLDKGRLQERKRIAAEIHDGVLAQMIGIRWVWEYLKIKGDAKTISKHRQNLAAIQQLECDLKDISRNMLNDFYITENEYIPNIKKMLKKWGKIGSFKVQFEVGQPNLWEELEDSIKVNLYKIMEESLHNVSEHAKATLVMVCLEISEGFLKVSIEDDGKGLTKKSPTVGIGINNMKSRTTDLGGRFLIESKTDNGTRINIRIPLKEKV